MVFESLVVDLINRFLGDFVENLDTSQLKIGIWGGSVVLDNLNIKESALDELDLPVKVKAGHISKLVLKIPWTNLYTEPVIAEIDGIYALAVPNIGVKYDAKKEEKILQDIKQKKLAQIEEAKKLEAERRQPKEVKKDTFAEKLTTQIVKNLQVKVNNIHVRYEDCYTNPARPFSFGITLQELLFQTTDEEWNPCIIKEAVTQIYKLVKLDSLSIYWNCYSNLLNQEESSVILDSLRSNIAGHGAKPEYQYVVRPISSVAHLRLHTKPEQKEFSIPKIGLTVVFDEIAIGLSKDQYDDILEMMESLERMTLLSVYRKYRPDKPLSGNTVLWWHYAYDSVLNETVRRRRQMWSWHHIAEHRKIMKTYREAYLVKLDKKLSAAVQKILDNSEKQLDVFNITLMRQQAEVQAAKQGAQRKESSSKSWFSGLFGKRKSSDSLEEEIKPGEMQEKFYELYTAEEKTKLYNAIGYEENEMALVYPKEYEAVKVVTKFRNVAIFLRDRQSKDVHFLHRRETFFRQHQLLKLQLKDVYSYFGQRPAAGAIHLDAKIDRMVVSGTPQNDAAPRLITSQIQDAKEQIYSLANLSIATNPLDGLCDTRIRFKGRPLEIVYDAVTINKLAEFFKPPKSVELKQLSQAAMSKFDEIKEQSTAGIQHALQQHKYTDIGVDLMPSIIIVPEGGLMKNDVRKLILDLGQLTVVSSKHDTSIDPQIMSVFGQQVLELAEKLKKAYDRFDIRLQRMQLLLANPGENWQLACTAGQSPQHVLSPMDILLDIRVCIFDKDPRMAKTKVHGVLPNLSLRISDKRVHEIMTLALSIPLPESAPVDEEPETEMFKGPSDLPASLTALSTSRIVNTAIIATAEHTDKERAPELRRLSSVEYTNMTDMELNFEIKEMVAVLSQRQGDTEIPVLKLMVESVGTEVQMRRFDMLVDAHIGTVYAQHLKYQLSNRINEELLSTGAVSSGPLINLVNTPSVGEDQKLLSVTFLQAKKTGPEFSTLYRNIEKNIQVNFSAVEILLHQRAILDLMELANSLVPPSTDDSQQSKNLSDDKAEAGSSLELWKEKEKGSKKRKEDPNLINLKVTVVLSKFSVGVCNDERLITNVQIKGICAEVAIQQARTTVSAILRETTVFDPDPHTRYHRILCIEGSNVLKAGAVVYNGGTAGNKYSDMSCFDTGVDVEIGCIKVFFVNKFISDLLGFMDNFQAAKDQMQKAGQVAAQVGMDTVQSLQETATRLLLKVNMKAPVIVVPQNSTSSNTLMLDFGQLSITNSFKLAGKLSPNNVPAILEEMNIVLTSLKLSRALMKGDTDISAECLILEPLTVSLQMRRNLSASWYHESPELELCGALEPLNVRLSQGDFGTMMQILNENLREGQPQASTKSNAVASSHSPETVVPSVSTTSKMLTEMEKHRPDVYVRIKVDVQLKGVIAVFYSGDTVLTSGICKREPSSSLGKFELVSMSAVAIIMSNDALKAKVSLNDLILDDLRLSKRTGITRMIERSKSGRNHSSDMVCVDFQQDAEKCLNVKISISSLYICVCVEFLMSLANFFTQGLGEISDSALKPKQGAMQSGLTPPVHSDQKQELQIMEVVLEMEKPEIILIEDQMNQSTKSLAVDLALSFRLIQTPEVQKINAGINGIQVFMCTFDSRHIPSHQILVPFDISVVSSAPYGQNHHVDVTFSDIVLVISPSILTTISLISRGLTPEGSKTSPLFLSTLASVPKWKVPANLWDVKTLASCNLWYIESAKQETKEADLTSTTSHSSIGNSTRREEHNEQMVVSIPSIVIELEGGVGNRTVPLLILESKFWAQVHNWSTQLSVEGSLDVEIGYYNEKRAVWEPLLEPVTEEGKTRRWALDIEVLKNEDTLPLPDESDDDEQEIVQVLQSKMIITVSSSDALQLTVTKSCLDMLTNLGKAFNDAYNLVGITEKKQKAHAPFVFVNNTGLEILLKLDPSFEPPENASQGRVKLPPDASLSVYNRKEAGGAVRASMIKATQEGDERKIIFQVEEFGATREVTIKRAEKRLFQINQRSHHGDVWSIVCVTDCSLGQKVLYLRSIVQIKNSLHYAVEVFYEGDTELQSCGVAHPHSVFSMPLKAVYSLSSELYFRPCIGSYELSMEPFNWRSAENSGLVQISCPDIQKGFSACYFNIEAEVEKIFFESGEEKNAKSFFFHLQPTVILHNLLPFTISYLLEGTADHESLTKGENRPLMHACFTETTLGIVIPSYQNEEWMGCCQIQCNTPLLTTCSFEAGPESNRASLDLGLHCKLNKGTLDVSLFCPYWMINKTGKWLAYRGSDQSSVVQHPPDAEALVLFSYKRKSFFSAKKKAQLQIENLEWSDKFSLDTVGSSGTVQCRSKTEEAEVGVKIYLSSSGLTKVVTFTPYYLLLNISTESILITDHENWIEVPSQQVIPFYPYPSENITIKAKIKGTSEETVPFPIDQAHSTMLRLDNEYGAICAECQVTESSMITTLKGYSPGLAAVRVVNHIENFSVTFYQCGLKDCQVTVPSQHTVLYTWDLPMGVREIVWSCGNKRNVKNNLSEDDMDEFFADDDTKVYWVTFLDGLQRVLLFTEDLEIAVEAQEAGELEHVEKELLFQLQSFGLSLVNDLTQEELAFLGITSSGIIWEEKKKRRYKALKLKDCKMLEEAYQKYHNDLVVGKIPNITVQLENKMEVNLEELTVTKTSKRKHFAHAFKVDFSSMTAVKPRTFPIRRIFENGIWFNFKSSAHQQQLHAKINRLQFDNQMAHAIFPTVLSPVAPPKTVAADSAPKSFIEVSLMMRMHEHSNVSQIKYFKVLVQEMNVKVSQEFLNAVLDFLAPTEPLPRIQETIQFLEDIKLSEKSLMNLVGLSLSEEQKNFYDYLHLSPLKIHLSFSLQNSSGSTETMELHAGVLNVFLQSVGVVLTDIQDVVFKLGYFERSHACYNQSQLIREVSRHYIGQAIKQTYVLVLGLDVLGNPFGLLRGLSEGIEDLFYEPYQGAIQGPEEFAEGLALGVRSLFGHTVGGAAGAVSRITGTLGKGLASLTLDEEYQKKRQAQLNKRPATATEGFARGGKGLVMGVFDGVTGIVRKPVEGARQEGVSGFFKGVGKGLVGVVTRPTSGVVDFASSSFEGIRRITEMTDEIKRLRPARRFYKDGVIRPYVHQEAEGYEVLKETDKGKFIATDEYQAHVVVSKDGKNIFLLTDKRIIMAKLGEIFGSWDCEWSYTWAELKEPPKRIPKGIEIILKEKEKKKFFSGGASKKEVTITDPIIVEWILLRIEEQMTRNR